MIVKLIISPFLSIIKGIITALPYITVGSDSTTELFNMLVTGLNFFPPETWLMVLGSITFWMTIHFLIGLLRFVFSLIPIINVGHS